MRLRVASLVVVLALCLSLIPALAPPLASRVQANPMQTMNLVFGQPSYIQQGNSRFFTLSPSQDVIQFTRPDLVVGNNATGTLVTVSKMSQPVSGDLTGTVFSDFQSVSVTWDGLPSGTGKGYSIHTFTFDDGHANTFSGIGVVDFDFGSLPYLSGTGRMISTSGTGTFFGKKLIGTCTLSGTNGGGTATFRCYSGSEITRSAPTSAVGTTSILNQISLGSSIGPQPYDEFLQFSRANITVPTGTSVYYSPGFSSEMTVSGGLSGTILSTADGLAIPDTAPEIQGWNVGAFTYQGIDGGAFKGIVFLDSLGVTGPDTITTQGYVFALMDNATGTCAGKDYYGVYDNTVFPTGTFSASLDLYTMTPPGVGVQTATGTGTATLSPSSGTIQNLAAVRPPTSPVPPVNNLVFPDGMFSFNITGFTGSTVTVTIWLPSGIPTNAGYYKYDSINGWSQISYTVVSAHEIAITLADDGTNGDLVAGDGVINDPGGLGGPVSSGGAHSAPVFPSIYVGIGAALGAGIVAYAVRRRLAAR